MTKGDRMSDADKTDAAGSSGIRASRRTVIKGVIASGVAVGAAGYIVYDRYGGGNYYKQYYERYGLSG